MTDHYDVIVIGSGAGGGTLTYALAPTGKRILLLERGDFLPREPQNWDSKAVWVDLRYHNSGNWTDASTGEEFPPKQNYYVGGNTKVYGAILFRFRERDFGEIQHVDGVSPAWPLSYADFEPWYTRAEHLYHVHGQHGADPGEPPSAAPYRYPPLSHEPRIAQLEADLTKAGLHPFPLPVGLIYDESAPQFSPCIRCATCDGYPCLVNGKADAHIVCVEPALRYPNVSLRTRARVTRLETDGPGRAVTRVVVDRDGQAEAYSADLVVVSAGAINSAALLLASATERHPDGLGNSSGVVGRHLMMHNNSSLIAFSKIPNPTRFQKTLGVNDFYFGDPDDDGGFPYPLGALQMLGKNGQVHSEVGQTALAAASIADFAAIVLLSLFFSSSGGSTGAGRGARRVRRTCRRHRHRRLRRGPVHAAGPGACPVAGHHRGDQGPLRRPAAGGVHRAGRAVRPGIHPGRLPGRGHRRRGGPRLLLAPELPHQAGGNRLRIPGAGVLRQQRDPAQPDRAAAQPVRAGPGPAVPARAAGRARPARTARPACQRHQPTLALGLLQATSLPFIVTATQIGVALGKISSVTAAALVCAGLLSVLIFPPIALGLLRRNEPGPAAVPDTTVAVPEPHLM
jgi:choline dehydrogenase-like flavoprotein